MKRKNQFSTSNKYWLLILAIICIVLMGLSGFAESGKGPLSWAAGYTIVPMQKGINRVGMWIGDVSENFATLQEIKKENKELKSRLEEMTTENNRLQQNSATLERYKELYKMDQNTADYPKVAARVISRDGNNWFHVFTIDKGKKDGIQVDMNVIAGNGLVGIVSEVGESYAKVRAIIDDKSNVSAMFQDTGETCIVKGNMESIYKGYIDIEMISNTAKIKDGDEVVTSHVSDKFLQGLSVGYVKDIVSDPSSQTKTAHLIPSVNFDQLENVLVITQLKDNSEIKDIKNYD